MSAANKGLGFKLPSRWPSKKELVAHAARASSARAAAGYYPMVLGSPTILDQGGAGACTGFAAVQCAHIATGKDICSPAFSYYNNRLCMNEGSISDSGADPDSVDAALNQFGLCPLEDAVYSDDPYAINARPHDLAYMAAQQIKCNLQPILETGSALFDACTHVLSVEQLPLFLAVEVTPAYDNSTGSGFADDPSGPSRGLHAICAYGWDDIGILTAGSWGTAFGRNGIVTLSPRFLGANCVYAASFEVLK